MARKPARLKVRNSGKLSGAIRKQISDRSDMPTSAFLVPGEKKYPVKKKDSKGNWVYDANMLLAAERRAIMNGRRDIARRARSIRIRLTK